MDSDINPTFYLIISPSFRRGQVAIEYDPPNGKVYIPETQETLPKFNVEYVPFTRDMLVKAVEEIDAIIGRESKDERKT